MNLVHLTIITIILSLAVTPDSAAQAKRKKATIEFSCLLWEGPLAEPIYFKNEKKYIEVKPFTTSRSLPHKIAISKSFSLYVKRKEKVEKNGEMKEVVVYKSIGTAAIPADLKKILFILFPETNDEGFKLRITAFDDGTKGFPEGSFRFVNFSSSELKVKFARSTKRLPAKDSTIMRSGVDKKGGLIPFVIYNSRDKIVFETRLFAQTNGREIIFISPPKTRGELPRVKFISQLLPKIVPKPAEG